MRHLRILLRGLLLNLDSSHFFGYSGFLSLNFISDVWLVLFKELGITQLFCSSHHLRFTRCFISIRKIDWIESFIDFLNFTFYTFAPFHRKSEDLLDFLFTDISIRINYFHKAGDGFVYAVLITSRQGIGELEVFAILIGVVMKA